MFKNGLGRPDVGHHILNPSNQEAEAKAGRSLWLPGYPKLSSETLSQEKNVFGSVNTQRKPFSILSTKSIRRNSLLTPPLFFFYHRAKDEPRVVNSSQACSYWPGHRSELPDDLRSQSFFNSFPVSNKLQVHLHIFNNSQMIWIVFAPPFFLCLYFEDWVELFESR